jgi:hypothetical protein
MLQAALAHHLLFDLFPFPQDGFVATKVDVGRCDVVQALVVTLVVIILDKGADLTLKIARKIVVFEEDAAFSLSDASVPFPGSGLPSNRERGSCLGFAGGKARCRCASFFAPPAIPPSRLRCSRNHCPSSNDWEQPR